MEILGVMVPLKMQRPFPGLLKLLLYLLTLPPVAKEMITMDTTVATEVMGLAPTNRTGAPLIMGDPMTIFQEKEAFLFGAHTSRSQLFYT